MTEERGVSRRVVIHVRILPINGNVRSVSGRSGEMPRSRSLVKAFDLIPVVEQVLPDRQKTEVRRSDLFTNSDVGYMGAILPCIETSILGLQYLPGPRH